MINWLGRNQYCQQHGENIYIVPVYEGRERCKNLSEILWPSNHRITHTMWQESIDIDESRWGWRFVPQRGKRKMFQIVMWKLLCSTLSSSFFKCLFICKKQTDFIMCLNNDVLSQPNYQHFLFYPEWLADCSVFVMKITLM